jgi:hypothetical protein
VLPVHVRLLTGRLLAGQGEDLGQGVVRRGGALGEGREELAESDAIHLLHGGAELM